MNDHSAAKALRRGDQSALEYMIDKYSSYSAAIVYNIIGGQMPMQDVEEVVSDVFVSLWNNAEKPEPGKMKGYIAVLSRNKAKNKLREARMEEPLEDDIIIVRTEDISKSLEEREQSAVINAALSHGSWSITRI